MSSTNRKSRMDRILLICLLNSAACFLKAGELAEALTCCNQVTTDRLVIWYSLKVPRFYHLVQHLSRPYLHFLHCVSTPIHCLYAMKMQFLSCWLCTEYDERGFAVASLCLHLCPLLKKGHVDSLFWIEFFLIVFFSQVLEADPFCVKALFRRAAVHRQMWANQTTIACILLNCILFTFLPTGCYAGDISLPYLNIGFGPLELIHSPVTLELIHSPVTLNIDHRPSH